MNLEIGAIQKRTGSARALPRTAASSETFASGIAERYRASELTVSRAELALAYGAQPQEHHGGETRIDIHPALSFHEHSSFLSVPRETASGPRTPDAFGEAQAAALFERLFSRRHRVAAFPLFGPAQAAPGESLAARSMIPVSARPGAEPVERTMARPTAPESPLRGTGRASTFAGEDPDWGTPAPPLSSAKPFSLPPTEVKRVTEEVIREIDHRIIARKERLGRR